MEKTKFKEYIEQLFEIHTPIYFMDFEFLKTLINAICAKKEISKREILMLAYMVGANEEEANNLLQIKGYDSLYVRDREDAIWKFALNNRMDLESIIRVIFPKENGNF